MPLLALWDGQKMHQPKMLGEWMLFLNVFFFSLEHFGHWLHEMSVVSKFGCLGNVQSEISGLLYAVLMWATRKSFLCQDAGIHRESYSSVARILRKKFSIEGQKDRFCKASLSCCVEEWSKVWTSSCVQCCKADTELVSNLCENPYFTFELLNRFFFGYVFFK